MKGTGDDVAAARVPGQPSTGDVDADDYLDGDTPADQRADGGVPVGDGGGGLDERERLILDFERGWWRHAGAKEQAIRDTFDLSATRYYQLLNGLLGNEAALAYDPVLVKRLRRLRATRIRGRGSA